ncbi:MAG: serine/threonine-protein phosphatase, partial [Pseudomonadales bacterium]|nr:serine/threonine-protein phosphatase [Pseudomonadales bacterium]
QPGYQTRKTPAASGPASIDEDEQDDRDITWTPLLDEEKSDSTAPNYNRSDSHSYGFTDAGNCREHNEDAMLLNPSAGLWVVADGMGGHHDGAHASQAVVEALARVDLAGSMEQILERIKIALDQVNQELLDFANNQSESGICGSTVVGMIIRDNQCAFFWAGDSRLYLYRHNQLHQLSKDHSLEQEQIDQGIISANDENFSGKNLITRAVGGDDILAVDFCYHNLQVGDQFMLCSDGVYGELTHITMQQIMAQSESLEAAGTRFQNRISAGLAKDNFTGILVRF